MDAGAIKVLFMYVGDRLPCHVLAPESWPSVSRLVSRCGVLTAGSDWCRRAFNSRYFLAQLAPLGRINRIFSYNFVSRNQMASATYTFVSRDYPGKSVPNWESVWGEGGRLSGVQGKRVTFA